MHATIRRYEGVDTTRMNELVGKVDETFIPQIRELPGFAGYFLIEADNGVLSSISLFETPEQADESRKLVSKWISDENFSRAIPNPPKITSGKVVAQARPGTRLARPYSALPRGPAQPGLSCVRELRRGNPSEAEVDTEAVAGAVVDGLRLSPREIPVT